MFRRLSQPDETLRDEGVTSVKRQLFSGLESEVVGRIVIWLIMGQGVYGRGWESG